jgi:hypothetical protein
MEAVLAMVLSNKPFKSIPPEQQDVAIAAQTTSLMVAIASLWFFVSPWAYGFSLHESAWNSWMVGAIMLAFSSIRLLSPAHTSGFSRVNAVLAVWVFLSPWIYGYSVNGPRLTNSLAVGVFIFALSLVSAKTTSRPHLHHVQRG